MEKITKLGFAFTPEDMNLLRKLQAKLEADLGKASYIAVIRWALRRAEKLDA